MGIVDTFRLYQTQLKNRKFDIYIDYAKTDYVLDNNVDYQKIIKYAQGNRNELEYECDVDYFLSEEALQHICYNSLYFRNVKQSFLYDLSQRHDGVEAFYDVEVIPELSCINIVSDVLMQVQDGLFNSGDENEEEFYHASLGYISAKELDIIYRYNLTKLGSSKGNSAVLKKNLSGVILIPKTIGYGGTLYKLPLSKWFNSNCKLKCYMQLQNSIPYQGNSTYEECVSCVYHFGQLIEALHLTDNRDAISLFRNKQDISIDILYYLLSDICREERLAVLTQNNVPVLPIFVGDNISTLLEQFGNVDGIDIVEMDFADYIYYKHSLGFLTQNEFKNYLEVLL